MQKVLLIFFALVLGCSNSAQKKIGETEITKWQHGKNSAVSLTYDDSTINQFRVALPIMNELGLPATFYIITGAIPGSEFKPKFIGRPVKEIIEETENTPTDSENFFERASAIRFSGYEGTYEYHNRAARFYGDGELKKAYEIIDEGYKRIRNNEFDRTNGYNDELYNVLAIDDPEVDLITWEELRKYAKQGHEFGSHTILHPFLAVMDSANIHYELTKSKLDILNHLGPEHIFSAECPFGTEDERVMEYALQVFPALRNRMPHPWLEEMNRGSDEDPRQSGKVYVQWQRGALSDTPMSLMKSWIDTSLEKDNIWLVLVIHGVEGIGWEPLTKEELEEYFNYIKQKEDRLWVATFKDVTKYIRERMNATISSDTKDDKITVTLSHSLDKEMYDLPLTLKTYLPSEWNRVSVMQGERVNQVRTGSDEGGTYILYQASPNKGTVEITVLGTE